MGFEDDREDPWRKRDDGPFSKKVLLDTIVEYGAVLMGRDDDGREQPYYGVLSHAEELRQEGFIKRYTEIPLSHIGRDVAIWIPTVLGKTASGKKPA